MSIAVRSFARSRECCTHEVFCVFSDKNIIVFCDHNDDGHRMYDGDEYYRFYVMIDKDTKKARIEQSFHLDFEKMLDVKECMENSEEHIAEALPKLSLDFIKKTVDLAIGRSMELIKSGQRNQEFWGVEYARLEIIDVDVALAEMNRLINSPMDVRGFYHNPATHERCCFPANLIPELTIELDSWSIKGEHVID